MSNDMVHYPDCADDCERLAEVDREIQDRLVDLDAALTERNCWAIAAEILAYHERPHQSLEWLDWDYQSTSGTHRIRTKLMQMSDLAAAYAIAEGYGENWIMAMEGKDDA